MKAKLATVQPMMRNRRWKAGNGECLERIENLIHTKFQGRNSLSHCLCNIE